MKTPVSFSILFWINSSRSKNEQAELYVRLTIDQKRANISLNRKVDINSWDKNKSRLKGTNKTVKSINQYLDQVHSELFQCFQDLRSEGKKITAQRIKSRYIGDDENHFTMSNIIEYHNEKMGPKLNRITLKHYETSQKYIRFFIEKEYKTSEIYLNELSYSFVINFENFLRKYRPKGHYRNIGNNAVMKHIQRLRKMITLAYHIEWIDKDPFIKFKPSFEKRERDFLTDVELNNIEIFDTSIERLAIVRDLFVFSCYTGLAYVDMMKLKKDNISLGIDGNKWLVVNRQKTGALVKVPILSKSLFLINKYKEHPRAIHNDKLLPNLSNQKLNAYLKEIADLCGIKKNLTFHMARHTFATTVTLTNGVPIETVSKLLGHTKIATTQIYAKVIERKVSDDMSKLSSYLDKIEDQKSKNIANM